MIKTCPLCASHNSVVIRSVNSEEAVRHFTADETTPRFAMLKVAIERLWQGSHASLNLCESCGFQYADPFVAGDSEFYELAFERAAYPEDKWDFRRALKALDDKGLTPEKIIEIGAGFGYFLDALSRKIDSSAQIVATEYGVPALAALRAKGYDARKCEVQDLACEPADLLFAFQVLEHMDNLDGLIKDINRLVAPGGHVILAVPNVARINFNTANNSMLDMPPNHIGGWNRSALEYFAMKAGFEFIEFDTEPFRLGQFVKQDVVYSYLRRTQCKGTLAHWSRQKRSRWFGKALGAIAALAYTPFRLPVWVKAARRGDLGDSAFMMMRKPIG